jgi:beta-lactam-binding protein with PASTA domain
VVAIAALGVVVGAVLLAILISNLGGSNNPPPGTGIDATRTSNTPGPTASGGPASEVQRGVVPAVEGLPEAEAKKAIADAGYTVRELRSKNSADKGIVFSQSPAAGIEYAAGQVVQIFISEGQ